MLRELKTKKIRQKKCVICQTEFLPERNFQKWCSIDHAIEYANQLKQKALRKNYKEAKEHAKTRQDWLADVQKVFNQYIRNRDQKSGYGCISCGTKSSVQYAAGHYRTVGSSPELRFDEYNVNLQCNRRCNLELSGNIIEYRKGLIERYGIEIVEYLEGPHPVKKWTIPELKELKELYKKKLKELEK